MKRVSNSLDSMNQTLLGIGTMHLFSVREDLRHWERGVYAASTCEPFPGWECSDALALRMVKRRKRRAPPLNRYGTMVPLLLLFVIAGFSGCGRRDQTTGNALATNANQQAVQSPSQAQNPLPPPTAPPPNTEPPDLNRELRKWIVRNQRPPKNFEDFAATAGIQIPPPPTGKRYAIDKTMHVILVAR